MSLVVASDYRVRSFEHWWHAADEARRALLRRFGARDFVVYRSVAEPERVFVTLSLIAADRVQEWLRSGELLSWYNTAGVEDIPAVFIGSLVETIRYTDDVAPRPMSPASVVVARIMPVEGVDRFLSVVHSRADRISAAGCRQYSIYQAVDDPLEVMTLQEVDSRQHAEAWQTVSGMEEFYATAGVGIYPDLFIGTLAGAVDIQPVEKA